MTRSFRVIQPKCDSIFHGSTPVAAAKKVCSKECKAKSCVVIVQDMKTGKDYKYKVTRVYDPVTIERNGVEVTYDYKVTAKSMNKTSSRSKSRTRSSRSKKCPVGKVWRRSYRSPSGKKVAAKCVKKGGKKSKSKRSKSKSKSRSRK
jgi:hypothetical protein